MKRTTWLTGVIVVNLAAGAAAQAAAPTPAPSAAGSAVQGRAADHRALPLDRRVTLDLSNVRLAAALDEIVRQAQLNLSYTDETVPVDKLVSIRVRRVPAREALKRVLSGTGLVVHASSAGELTLAPDSAPRRSEAPRAGGEVWGRVIDSAAARPLPDARVSIIDASDTVSGMTNENGFYLLTGVSAGVHVVRVRHLGYMPVQREVAVVDGQRVREDFALKLGMTRLQEVVTTATGPKRRMEIANDITVIDADSVVATQPITSVTDLLEGRVPGLTMQRTSGAPGDPSRLRLRGVSSISRSNDPIVIVDGVRVYYNQSDSRSVNLASSLGMNNGTPSAAPSPLDQLDVHSIETIEVVKGPSAATLYGADAANGVIVITTKRGHAGPAQWTMSATRGRTTTPGSFPVGYYRWGHLYGGDLRLCSLTSFSCQQDSVVRFQALNDRRYSPMGTGTRTDLSLGVSGGSAALTYTLTGSYADETGLLTLPTIETQRFATLHGGEAPPTWMHHPQQLTQWGAVSRLSAALGAHADASVTTTLSRTMQQRSSLENQLGRLMATYADPFSNTYWLVDGSGNIITSDGLVPDFYERTTDAATNVTTATALNWRPRRWLTTSADAGLNVVSRQDQVLLPRSMRTDADSIGHVAEARGSSILGTVNLRATATAPLALGFRLQVATGANYTRTTVADLATGAQDLAAGTSSLQQAGEIVRVMEQASEVTSFGWYVEPSLTHQRFTISTGLRLDGSSSFGTHAKIPAFPKLGASWLLSEEPFFPAAIRRVVPLLRVRAAYGRAGVWPGVADRFRLYTGSRRWLDGGFVDATQVLRTSLGNTQLRPERSTEWEGGVDADLLGDRLSVGVSGYRKVRKDALIRIPVPPSVYGFSTSVFRNIGEVRNTGLELSVSTQLVRTAPVTWSVTANLSRNHNIVTRLGPGVDFATGDASVVEGYPLFGRWQRPILSYADLNGNGVIEPSEVQVGDSAVYLGESEPNYQVNLATTFSLFQGLLTVDAGLAYQDGLTQENQTIYQNRVLVRGSNDPSAPFGQQAAVAALDRTHYGLYQTVSTLRFNSLSIAVNAPPRLAQRLGARAASVALQGTNLGLKTNYSGKDPNVNAYASGNGVADTGILPEPRSWRLAVRVSY